MSLARDLFAPSGWDEPVQPRPLWPHQERALRLLREALIAGHRRVVMQLPTGAGKTVLAAEMIRGALGKGKRVVFTVPALSLVEQTIAAFEAEGIDAIGVMQGWHERTDRHQPVQIASVQTLARRAKPAADLVIVDECHGGFAAILDWLAAPGMARVPVVGLSASPWARGMGKHWGELVIGATISELIEAGRLSPFRVYAPSVPDLSDVKVVAGEYHEGQISELMSGRTLIADAVRSWRELGTPDRTLCFAVDRAHAKRLQTEFSDDGVSCAYIDGETDRDEREAIKRDFHAGASQVVVSIGTMIAGVDWDVRCISWCRPTKSILLWVQAFGRGLRLGDGKRDLVCLDHAGTALALGLPTHIHRTKLDDGRPPKPSEKAQEAREQKAALPKACKSCGALQPPRSQFCSACGHKPERQCDIVVEDGELVEFGTVSDVAADAKPRADHETKQRFYSMLLGYAASRGKSQKWVLAQYKGRWKVWPRGMSEAPLPPSPEFASWITARNIAWAKSAKRRPA